MAIHLSSRRTFLAGGMALAGVRRLPAATARLQDDLKLGVATYSFRKFTRAQMIDMVRQLGVIYLSVKDVHLPYNSTPKQLAAARKEFADAGLKVLSGGVIYFEEPGRIRSFFEYAKGAGMPMIIAGPTHQTLPMLEPMVKEFDIKVAIHNHGPGDRNFPTPQSALEAIKHMDERIGLCIDIGHTARAGIDILEAIRQAGPRLLDLHVKDLKDTSVKGEAVPVGEGVLPIAPMFKLLRQLNYQGGVMLEYEVDADNPLPGMQKSFAYMRGVLAGLRA
jgi:sugar phosphate isomerase/epimerase